MNFQVFLRMTTYASQLQANPSMRIKDFTSLQELPRIFVNVTKAIGMFVDIWLGTSFVRERILPSSTISFS